MFDVFSFGSSPWSPSLASRGAARPRFHRAKCATHLVPTLGVLTLLSLLITPATGWSLLIVDTTTDSSAGNCSGAVANDCPLRRAIALAVDDETIEFDPTEFATDQTIQLSSELVVSRPMQIVGPTDGRVTLRGSGVDRVMRVAMSGTFSMSHFDITNGHAGSVATAEFGGGLKIETGSVFVEDVRFVGNIVNHPSGPARGGGGNVAVTGGSLRITNSEFFSGLAQGAAVGGGLFVSGGSVVAINCLFTGNESFNEGGAMAAVGSTSINLVQSTVTQNTATGHGGAFYFLGGNHLFEFVTVAFNQSVGSNNNAQEVYAADATGTALAQGLLVFDHSIVASPDFTARGPLPPPVCIDDVPSDQGIGSLGYNLFNRPCISVTVGSDVQQAVGLGPLTISSGTTFYPLAPGSPAIDGGQPFCSTTAYGMDFDQRGLPRRLDADADDVGQCDIGAVELQVLFADGFEGGSSNRWM